MDDSFINKISQRSRVVQSEEQRQDAAVLRHGKRDANSGRKDAKGVSERNASHLRQQRQKQNKISEFCLSFGVFCHRGFHPSKSNTTTHSLVMWATTLCVYLAALATAMAVSASVVQDAGALLPSGQPREFELVITWERYAPLGISRKMLLVNGQTPGPELLIDQDDEVVVHVVNKSPFNTTVHFHGGNVVVVVVIALAGGHGPIIGRHLA
ncbi:hypothetical protein NQ176_g509 [Zarea fungicola]|uniref:Uncharacterized protein n=1 Tax=Zarea fungicola TaxID=93591 RepID=A0ACC1NWK7_9HYPO|nr:hypothetical protein NQ176_g509 [Lecanicillium fungicola]